MSEADPHQPPVFQQPPWETPGPTYSSPPNPPAQQPYAPPDYGQPIYGQPNQPAYPMPSAYGQPAYDWAYAVQHPSATTAMILGIVSLVGLLLCQLLLVLGPVAWFLGAKARREINREPQRYTGRSQATAGMVTGIISTVLLVLGLVAVVLLVSLGGGNG